MTYLEILELAFEAQCNVLAFRRNFLQSHPDNSIASERFREASQRYEELSALISMELEKSSDKG